MSKQIEGVPEGYELVRIGKPNVGELFIDGSGRVTTASDVYYVEGRVIVRKKPRIQDTYTIPDGFRVLEPDEVCKKGDYFINASIDAPGRVYASVGMTQKQAEKEWETILLLRKIEKPKRYRPFANAEEFKPHRDRWVRTKWTEDDRGFPVTGSSNVYVWIGPSSISRTNWGKAFEDYVFDDTGEPFGVEVTDENPS